MLFFIGDELFSDTYKMRLIGGVLYEVEGKRVTESTVVDEKMYGGNASAEGGGDEGADDAAQTGCNIVLANRLQETSFTKKLYQTHIKAYIKKIIEELTKSNPERVDAFKEGAKKEVAQILSTFGDWDFFTGESNTQDAMVALLNYREDGITPYMLFWKDGLIEEKV
jgi:hypothetical protein